MRNLRRAILATAFALATGSAALAAGAYQVGDKVEAYSPMAGRWVAGTIVSIDGARYMFQADDHSLANDFWGATPERIRPVGAGATPQTAPTLAGRVAPAPAQPPPAANAEAIAPAQAAAGSCGGGGGGAVRFAGARPAPLGGGMFANGAPLGTPGQTNFLTNDRGQKSIVAVAPPGRGPFVGRYNLMVGGTWSTLSSRDLGGVTERTLNWNVPAQANVLAINADGTWYRKSGATILRGRWIDLGQNVAQLIGYDGDDWSGSMQLSGGVCRMEMRGPLGQNEWGRRF